ITQLAGIGLFLGLALALMACGSATTAHTVASNDTNAPFLLSTSTAPSRNTTRDQNVAAQSTPVPQATPENTTVTVWWPDELYPDDATTEAILTNQFDLFALTYTNYGIEVRHKRTHGVGGILSTLRTAAPVAPGALPDLTLMRRADMITAATDGLIVPIDAWIPADLAGANLFPGLRALGEVDGELYGVPYALDLYHTVYRVSVFDQSPTTYDAILAAETPYLFPGGASPVSWTILLQYIAAGGRLVDRDGNTTLTPEALLAVLDYYAAGLEAGIFGPDLIEHTTVNDYWNAFVTGEGNIASVPSTTYLALKDSVQNAELAPVPTEDGTTLTMIDGWMWVLTTQNPDQQTQALAFLSWMMRISQQSAFTEAYGIVPSQTRALRLWEDEAYADFAQELLSTAIVFAEERRNNAAATALNDAVSAVLRGMSPETATEDALRSLES
ncbi:MAG: extracellular solute-binding protein, partial [Anaerolineae bacterium]|nr:extracellular solute-binding protein [Anaerolineae bacterium]